MRAGAAAGAAAAGIALDVLRDAEKQKAIAEVAQEDPEAAEVLREFLLPKKTKDLRVSVAAVQAGKTLAAAIKKSAVSMREFNDATAKLGRVLAGIDPDTIATLEEFLAADPTLRAHQVQRHGRDSNAVLDSNGDVVAVHEFGPLRASVAAFIDPAEAADMLEAARAGKTIVVVPEGPTSVSPFRLWIQKAETEESSSSWPKLIVSGDILSEEEGG